MCGRLSTTTKGRYKSAYIREYSAEVISDILCTTAARLDDVIKGAQLSGRTVLVESKSSIIHGRAFDPVQGFLMIKGVLVDSMTSLATLCNTIFNNKGQNFDTYRQFALELI